MSQATAEIPDATPPTFNKHRLSLYSGIDHSEIAKVGMTLYCGCEIGVGHEFWVTRGVRMVCERIGKPLEVNP